MKIINNYLKKRIIRKYIEEVTPELIKGFGSKDQFTVPQIENTINKSKISLQHIEYAIALYRYEESNRTLKLYHIDQSKLNSLREEISDWFFGGYRYRLKDVIKLSKPARWRGGRVDDWHSQRMGQNARY